MEIRSNIFVGIFLVLFVGTVLSRNECRNGETKLARDGCNTCFCANGVWACTLKYCYQRPKNIYYKLRRQVSECSSGETKRIACNNCKCIQGFWACSKKACVNKRDVTQCVHGENRYDGCNSCSCIRGSWTCTERACLKEELVDF